MSIELQIRDATLADAETIVDFNERLAWESERKRLDRETLTQGVRRLLADPAWGRYFVACQEGQVVGQLLITYEWSDWRNGPIWWLQSVYVLPECRRQGVFRRLHAHVRQLAKDQGQAVALRLYVERNNHAAHAVYRQAGMEDAGYFVMEETFVDCVQGPPPSPSGRGPG
jgi:GNAT superfamily N-acetyltransferase